MKSTSLDRPPKNTSSVLCHYQHQIRSQLLLFATLATTITILLLPSPTAADVLTDTATVISSFKWDSDGNMGYPETGCLSSDGRWLVFATYNFLLVRDMELAYDFDNSTSWREVIVESYIQKDLVAPIVDPNSGLLYVAQGVPPAVITEWNLETLNRKRNPLSNFANGMDGTFASVFVNGYIYFFSKNGQIAKINPTNFTGSVRDIGMAVSSFAYDSVNNIFYFGREEGRILQFPVTESLDTTNATQLQLDTDETIVAVAVDEYSNAVYASTVGKSDKNPATIFQINVSTSSNWSKAEYQEQLLNYNDYKIKSAFVDPLGILYLGSSLVPGRLTQISMPNFEVEFSSTVGNNYGEFYVGVFNPNVSRFYVGSGDPLTGAVVIVEFEAAEACEGYCYNHGTCIFRYCDCDLYTSPRNVSNPWLQPWCQTAPCDYDCNGNAIACVNGTCLCVPTYTGELCDIAQCPNNCTNPERGICTYDNEGNPIECECKSGFTGDDCSIFTWLDCPDLEDCDSCNENPACGWCSSDDKCYYGDAIGPLPHEGVETPAGCRSWHYNECPSGAIPAMNIIITIFVGAMLLLGLITTIWQDSNEGNPHPRDEWYRYQRSSKTWVAIYQLQIVAATAIIGSALPTVYLTFSLYWTWALLGFGMPWGDGGPVNVDETETSGGAQDFGATGKRLLDYRQWQTYGLVNTDQMFLGFVIWYGVVFGICLLGILVNIIFALIRSRSFMRVLTTRSIYSLLRALQMGYLGVCIFGAMQMMKIKESTGMAVFGIVLYVLIGIVYPVVLAIVCNVVELKTLFKPQFQGKFFPFYGTIGFKKMIFVWLPFARLFLIGSFIGFLIEYPEAQLALVTIVFLGYVILCIVLNPFSDYLQRWCEVIINIINCLSMAFLFAFLKEDMSSVAAQAVTILFMIFQYASILVAFGFFFTSWLQMHKVNTLKQFLEFVTCKGPK